MACSEDQVSEPPSPSFYFIIIIIITNILVIEIKFVLGVQLSLVVPSPVHSVETSGRQSGGLESALRYGRRRAGLGFLCASAPA